MLGQKLCPKVELPGPNDPNDSESAPHLVEPQSRVRGLDPICGPIQNRFARSESRESNSVCGAKWINATTWLGSGTTASCHHPPAHKIPLEELKDNPSALHNTKYTCS